MVKIKTKSLTLHSLPPSYGESFVNSNYGYFSTLALDFNSTYTCRFVFIHKMPLKMSANVHFYLHRNVLTLAWQNNPYYESYFKCFYIF